MKKIMLVSNRVMHYRVSIYNYFFENFRARGYDFVVRADELQRGNPHPLKFDFRELPLNFFLYRREIRKTRPDLVVLFLHLKDLMIFPLLYWLRFKKIPVLFWTKGANLDDPENRLRNMMFHHVQNLSRGLILYSPHELRFIKEKNHHKVTYANNTVNYLDYPAVEDSKDDIKKALGIRFNKVALFVGRMDAAVGGRKKVDHAIRIFQTIDRPEYGLVLVGSGLSDALKESMNKNNTVYLGEVHDPGNVQISRVFKMADVFLMPGHVGLSLNQAFYWGLPVLTEEGKQPPEIHYLVSGRNGYIVKENDIPALKGKLLELFAEDEERRRLGENARNDILKNASIEGMFSGFLENIERLERRP